MALKWIEKAYKNVIDDVILRGHAHNMQCVLNRTIKSLHVKMVHK